MNKNIARVYKFILGHDVKADLVYMSSISHRIHCLSKETLEFFNTNRLDWPDPSAQQWIDSL